MLRVLATADQVLMHVSTPTSRGMDFRDRMMSDNRPRRSLQFTCSNDTNVGSLKQLPMCVQTAILVVCMLMSIVFQ